jgi:hypothetical protein
MRIYDSKFFPRLYPRPPLKGEERIGKEMEKKEGVGEMSAHHQIVAMPLCPHLPVVPLAETLLAGGYKPGHADGR